MKIRGKAVGTEHIKGLTERQLQIYDKAKKEGWFDQIKNENVKLSSTKNIKGLLDDIRRIFPDNYVGKEKIDGKCVYTIYTGDKEFNKMINETLIFDNSELSMKGYIEELITK